MQTVVLVHDRRELIDLINAANGPYKATEQNIEIEFYAVDDRIGWNTYLVSVDNKAVGMTDGPL